MVIMIGIVDYGMGNLLSVYNALEVLGVDVHICKSPDELEDMDRIILPGVGAFRDCILNLGDKGYIPVLNQLVLKEKRPILGICLGMQMMAKMSYEFGETKGLGWIDAEIVRLSPVDQSLRIPHIGWNNITFRKESTLFNRLVTDIDVYFVHSYYMRCTNQNDIIATFDYSGSFTAAIQVDYIIGVQFHPEKSQDYGLQMLQNFINWDYGNA